MKTENNISLFSREEKILSEALLIQEKYQSLSPALGSNFKALIQSYKKLLRQVKQLTRLSDSQHRKLLQVQEQLLLKSDQLLLNILPAEIADELKRTDKVAPKSYFATILFTDFVGFTGSASKMTPLQVVNILSETFDVFDSLCCYYNMETIKTIGDAYMCVGGLPQRSHTHPFDAVLTAIAIREYILKKKDMARAAGRTFWDIRIGIHTGEVAAGIIGINRFVYDIWGDAVNIANRMENHAPSCGVNISKTTFDIVHPFFECSASREVDVKGKGKMEMYAVHRIKPELQSEVDPNRPNMQFFKILDEYELTPHRKESEFI